MLDKTILITGATAGFGKAIAKVFADKGWNLILMGRRKERFESINSELNLDKSKVLWLNFDVRNETETSNAINSIPQKWQDNISVLVNNAGLAVGRGPIDEGITEDWNRMIDTNIKGLLHVTQSVIPILKKNSGGHIVNIGSIAGKEVYPGGNVYCASKHAVDALSKAMRIDLLPYDIKVTNIAPGAAETEFSIVRFKGDDKQADKIYDGYTPLVAQDIAETVDFVVSRPMHVTINDLTIMPTAQASASILKK